MILVNPFKAKGITAMFRSLARGKRESATTVGNFNIGRAACSLPEVYIESEGIRIGAVRVAEEARVPARGRHWRRERPQAVLNADVLQFGKPAT
jgi:hypothetical protein